MFAVHGKHKQQQLAFHFRNFIDKPLVRKKLPNLGQRVVLLGRFNGIAGANGGYQEQAPQRGDPPVEPIGRLAAMVHPDGSGQQCQPQIAQQGQPGTHFEVAPETAATVQFTPDDAHHQ